jgi:hypothetical protein
MASSDLSLPLKARAWGLNLAHLGRQIVLSEYRPSSAYNLLVHEWNMGPNLANTFIDYYGGHILNLQAALNMIAIEGDDFNPKNILPQVYEEVSNVIDANQDDLTLFPILADIAIKGYHMIDLSVSDQRDAVIRKLCDSGIAMLLVEDSTERTDFPINIWNNQGKDCLTWEIVLYFCRRLCFRNRSHCVRPKKLNGRFVYLNIFVFLF